MEALIIKVFIIIFEVIIGLVFSFLLLLISRVPLCNDIEESTGKRVFKNKKKKNKSYPNRIRWFFLLDYLPYIKKWHYIFFILDILFSFALVVVLVLISIIGWNPYLKIIGEVILWILLMIKIIITYFPTTRHRKKIRKLS